MLDGLGSGAGLVGATGLERLADGLAAAVSQGQGRGDGYWPIAGLLVVP